MTENNSSPQPRRTIRYGDRYRWLDSRGLEPLPMAIFFTPTLTCLHRAGVETFGDLAELSDAKLGAIDAVTEKMIREVNEVLTEREQYAAYADRYPWITSCWDEQVIVTHFDRRSQTTLSRAHVATWGDLGKLSDVDIRKIKSAGDLTIARINDVLASITPPRLATTTGHTSEQTSPTSPTSPASPSSPSSPTDAAIAHDENVERSDDPTAGDILLRSLPTTVEWAAATGVATTLGELIAAVDDGVTIPDAVVDEIDGLLALQLPNPADDLVDLLDRLTAEARDPELLIARKGVRTPPTLDELGRTRNLTRERIHQRVVDDAKRVRLGLQRREYTPVGWAIQRFCDEAGPIVAVDSDIVARWRERCGVRFDVFGWLADYAYDGDWLLANQKTVAQFFADVEQMVGDEWLLSTTAIAERMSKAVDSKTTEVEPAVRFLVESGRWRDIGDGWLVRWDGPIEEKAERVLQLTCTPMTADELVAAIGHGTTGTLLNSRGERLIRVDKEFRLGLVEWGLEEYEGIVVEICQRIERGGGEASVAAIVDEFEKSFGVSTSSITAYLNLSMFNVDGDTVRLGDPTEFSPRSPTTSSDTVKTRAGWGERHVVSEATYEGYSFNLNADVAWANGIRPGDNLLVPINDSTTHEASVIWRTTTTTRRIDVGRLREWLDSRDVAVGMKIVICPTPENVTVFVGDDEIGAARRAVEPETPAIAPDIAAIMERL